MDEKTKIGEHYACVINDGKYVDFVIVEEYSDGTESPYMYELKQGESLAKTNPPTMKVNADSVGFIKPLWNGKEWEESATPQEIAEWNEQHPVPVPVPTDVEILQEQVTDLQLALCEQYEENLMMQEELTSTQLALVELYEGGLS